MSKQNAKMQNSKSSTEVLKRFWLSIKEWKIKIIIAAVLSLISTLLMLFGPMILGMMTTSATNSIKNHEAIKWGE